MGACNGIQEVQKIMQNLVCPYSGRVLYDYIVAQESSAINGVGVMEQSQEVGNYLRK